jgi:hypothetical protein
MTTTPTTTVEVSSTMVNSNQKCSQKWGASDLFSNMALLKPTSNNEKVGPPAKKGKTYLKPNNQATGCPTLCPIEKGSGEKTTRSTTTEAENKARSGDNICSGIAKH